MQLLKRFLFRALTLSLVPALLLADQVVLKNGDRLTGTIVEKNASHITIETIYGLITVDGKQMMMYDEAEKIDPKQSKTSDRRILSHIVVAGLEDSKGAKVMLINAGGPKCRDSVLLSDDDPKVWTRISTPHTSPLIALLKKKDPNASAQAFNVNIASHAPENVKDCWCGNGDGWKAEQAGLAVMAPGKAIAYFPNQQRSAGFRLCVEPKLDFIVNLRSRREVPVMVWVRDGNDIPEMAKDDIANTDWVLDKQLTGITLRPTFSGKMSEDFFKAQLKSCYTVNPNDPDDHKACCQEVARSDIFDPASINVYYGVGSGNFTCLQSPTVPASFIHDVPILGDAAHELSHALGLSQQDSDPESCYSTGHTSPLAPAKSETNFSCGNVMWEGTHYLKSELSPGQAFWMSQSCSSFVGRNSACLSCSDQHGAASPCPLFSLGHSEPKSSPCVNNTVLAEKILVPRHLDESVSCDLPHTTYADGLKLEAELSARYDALKAHVKKRPDLALGALYKGHFLRMWEPNIALNLAGAAATPKLVVPRGLGSRKFKVRDVLDKILNQNAEFPACIAEKK